MRTKEEVISGFLGDIDPNEVSVRLNSELVKDIMNLWAEEVLTFVVLGAESFDLQDIVKIARQKMYSVTQDN